MKIQAQALEVTFRPPGQEALTALRNLNLEVGAGEFLAIVGASGCGKTTLLRVLAGLERHSGGSLHIQHQDSRRPRHAIVFQDSGLFPWMSVLENIAYGMRIQGIPGPERYKRALHWMNRVGLGRFADSFPKQLSGGMQQRVGLARAFAHGAEILLMDEPFAALDAQTRLALQASVLELWQGSDATVIFVTHSIEEAITLADRVVVMSARPGRILSEFKINFPRPRDPMALRLDPAFDHYYAQIWDILREQVPSTLI